MNSEFSTEQLTDRWEDRRAIKNLMGEYANMIILNREQEIFEMFWSKKETDICLGFNNGYYKGTEAISGYYQAIYEGNLLKAQLLQKRFPEKLGEKSMEEIYGIGPFKVKPLGSAVIEEAEDGKTAKGLWHCQGAYAEIETAGPVSYWTWGYFGVDFIKEGDNWKLWHMLCVNDIDCPCGQSWGKPIAPYPDLPEFEDLRGFKLPEPNVPGLVREMYSPTRPYTPAPPIPEAYVTFSDTFSYGI